MTDIIEQTGTTLNDFHTWLFSAGYEHIWFEFEAELIEREMESEGESE